MRSCPSAPDIQGKSLPAHPRLAAWTVAGSLAALGAEVAWRFPHYIAYFNGIVAPADGWRHLVDSSLDWGQDLPGLRRYLDGRPVGEPAFLAYFGTASPTWYGIRARLLAPGPDDVAAARVHIFPLPPADPADALQDFLRAHPELDPAAVSIHAADEGDMAVVAPRTEHLRLLPGVYCFSATRLQPVANVKGAWGPWNRDYEDAYGAARAFVAPLLENDPAARRAALARVPPGEWATALGEFEELRYARLAAWLRRRGPDTTIGYSILIFHLTAADLAAALDGPPAELGPNLPQMLLGGAADTMPVPDAPIAPTPLR